MKRNVVSGAVTYMKNVGKHARRVVAREETVWEACSGIMRDGRKLARLARHTHASVDRKQAMALVRKGRDAYNQANYRDAQERFHEAILADPNYALAYTYLGNAYYQMSRFDEAIGAWRRALRAEPGSDGAAKAQAKLDHIEQSTARTIQELQDRFLDR
jgi:tetratricopeptide (TPR) repeat protein